MEYLKGNNVESFIFRIMKYLYSVIVLLFSFVLTSFAQEISMTDAGTLEQVYEESVESEDLLPFNELNMEFGYVLYKTEIEVESEKSVLELENVRDYAAVYLDNKLQGTMMDNCRSMILNTPPGKYILSLYVENIGRITYGPEILDNSKGLFGNITLDGRVINNWTIIPLSIKECDVKGLQFNDKSTVQLPAFHKGHFELETPGDTYIDISGWGIGEVWINGHYVGSYWDEEKQQSIQVPAENLQKGKNEIVVFDLKNNAQKTVKLSDKSVFK